MVMILVSCTGLQQAVNNTDQYDSNRITSEEIANCSATNAYEIIRMLRPNWLQPRYQVGINIGNTQLPVVYLNDMPYGGPSDLVAFLPHAILEMRYLHARDTNIYLGRNYPGGAIIVTMK